MPANWEQNIMGFLPETDRLEIGFNVTRPNDPIDGLFGDLKTDNLLAEWESLAAEYQIPMMAQFHGFDTESRKTFRVPIDTHNIEKGLIKVKINQSERMRALLNKGVDRTGSALYDYVLNDGIRLADQVFTRSKVAKNELMATGKVTIKENNLDLTVDYGVDASHMAYTLNLSDSADVSEQIQDILDDATEAGVVITGMMTSKRNITKLRKNLSLQKIIGGSTAAEQLIPKAALNTYFETELGISTIITNDQVYGKDATIGSDGRPVISTARYFPKDKITFFATNPGGKLGTGLWGNPPEADDFEVKTGASGVSPYVWVTQWFEKDPHVLWTKASALYMPVLYNPNSIWSATISE